MSSNDPFAGLPEVPSFTVTSTTLTEGGGTPPAQMSGLFGVPGTSPRPAGAIVTAGAPGATAALVWGIRTLGPSSPELASSLTAA